MKLPSFWIGGSPCAGKSSVAELLAVRYNLIYYRCDDHFTRHAERALPGTTLSQLRSIDGGTFFMRPPAELLQVEQEAYREEFEMILQDVGELTTSHPVLVEGAALLPELVAPCLAMNGSAAVWMVPTPSFQRHHYARRLWIGSVLRSCKHPDVAFANWMSRDEQFGRWISAKAKQLELPLLIVDGTRSLAENTEIVARHLGLEVGS